MNKETQSESFVDGFIRKYEGIIKNSVYNPNYISNIYSLTTREYLGNMCVWAKNEIIVQSGLLGK